MSTLNYYKNNYKKIFKNKTIDVKFIKKMKVPPIKEYRYESCHVGYLGKKIIQQKMKYEDSVGLIKIEKIKNKYGIDYKHNYCYGYIFQVTCPKCGNTYTEERTYYFRVGYLRWEISTLPRSSILCNQCREMIDTKLRDNKILTGTFWKYFDEYRKLLDNKMRNHIGFKTLDEVGTSIQEMRLHKILKSIFKNEKIIYRTRDILPNYLELDFYLPKFKLAIEYQGEQHTRFIKGWHKTKEGFEKVKERDKRKKELCGVKGIRLIEIHYKEPLNLKYIEEKLK